MERRTVIAVGGLGLIVSSGYALIQLSSPKTPPGIEAESLYVLGDVSTDDFSREDARMSYREEYYTIITSESTAKSELVADDQVAEFIGNTDFDKSYIVVVQNGMQSMPDLELDSIHRSEDGLRFNISVDAPMSGVDDDLAIHSLLIRITDSEEGVADSIDLDISGYV